MSPPAANNPNSASGLSDEKLVERSRKGDDAALRTLVERYHGDLHRFLYRLTGDQAGADDVFQETFLQVYLSAASFDTSRRFRPWLFTIAANKARDYLRRKGRRKMLELSAPVGGAAGNGDGDGGSAFVDLLEIDIPGPDAGMRSEELNRLVQRAVDTLSPTLKEILLLAYFQQLSYAQIADELDIPLGTVKSRLHAAVAAFAKAWRDQHPDDLRSS
jgi:RNA polymerase sigma-70 factor (ECF subfamily)